MSGGAEEPALREALARWASGVTLVAVDDDGDRLAMVASAFTPVSLDPPLVLVCVRRGAMILPSLRDVGRFVVSLLAAEQHPLASNTAAGLQVPPETFADGADPLVRGALASLVCTVREVHPGGDHVIVVGEVEEVFVGEDGAALAYFRRGYVTVG